MNGRLTLGDLDETIRFVLDSGGEFTLWPRGRSMRPCITQGRDSVVLTAPGKRLHRGDIALYLRRDGSCVLHRVIAVSGGRYTVCGDNQLTPEPGINRSQIIAVVDRINRSGRTVAADSFFYRAYVRIRSIFSVRRAYFLLRRLYRRLRKAARQGSGLLKDP